MRLIITTQTLENYGAHDWDGTGQCPQYWKAKGGDEYEVYLPSIDGIENLQDYLSKIVDKARPVVECDDDYYKEYIVNWEVLADNELTDFERFCVEEMESNSVTQKLEWMMPEGEVARLEKAL